MNDCLSISKVICRRVVVCGKEFSYFQYFSFSTVRHGGHANMMLKKPSKYSWDSMWDNLVSFSILI